jgi:uncharacterized protein YyaL (SSP411 family)
LLYPIPNNAVTLIFIRKPIFNLITIVFLDLLKKEHPIFDNSTHINEAVRWLCRAQDSTKDNNGVSEGYHLFHGWLPSYPETTGYIIETFFDYFRLSCDETIKNRAILMADWLIAVQNEDGSVPDSHFRKKMVFDTGQVIFGFVKAYEETKREEYKKAAVKAGEWLTNVQEKDGSWQKYAFKKIPHTYYTRVAWSLAKLYSITKEERFLSVCVKNIHWAIAQQEENGWFNCASFNLRNHTRPYTHTIAYTIRGILETGLYLRENTFIESAIKSINNLLENISDNGGIHGSYDRYWKGDKRFSCLTGSAQLAIILFKIYMITKNNKYLIAGKRINEYLKRKQELRIRNNNIYGAVAGSYPIWGEYIHFMYPNWASKFFVDSLMLEKSLERS